MYQNVYKMSTEYVLGKYLGAEHILEFNKDIDDAFLLNQHLHNLGLKPKRGDIIRLYPKSDIFIFDGSKCVSFDSFSVITEFSIKYWENIIDFYVPFRHNIFLRQILTTLHHIEKNIFESNFKHKDKIYNLIFLADSKENIIDKLQAKSTYIWSYDYQSLYEDIYDTIGDDIDEILQSLTKNKEYLIIEFLRYQ